MAVEEINPSGAVLGKELEIASRNDGGNPGDAVRVAEGAAAGEGIRLLCGMFLSNVGLTLTESPASTVPAHDR